MLLNRSKFDYIDFYWFIKLNHKNLYSLNKFNKKFFIFDLK